MSGREVVTLMAGVQADSSSGFEVSREGWDGWQCVLPRAVGYTCKKSGLFPLGNRVFWRFLPLNNSQTLIPIPTILMSIERALLSLAAVELVD